jgi:hypothetical protein
VLRIVFIYFFVVSVLPSSAFSREGVVTPPGFALFLSRLFVLFIFNDWFVPPFGNKRPQDCSLFG